MKPKNGCPVQGALAQGTKDILFPAIEEAGSPSSFHPSLAQRIQKLADLDLYSSIRISNTDRPWVHEYRFRGSAGRVLLDRSGQAGEEKREPAAAAYETWIRDGKLCLLENLISEEP